MPPQKQINILHKVSNKEYNFLHYTALELFPLCSITPKQLKTSLYAAWLSH